MNLRIRSLAPEDVVLLAAVVALPWAFGGVESWAWRPAAGLVGVAAGIALMRRGPAGLGLTRGSGWLIPAALIVLWVFVQAVPMPPALVAGVSPAAAATWDKASRDLEAEALARIPGNLPAAPVPARPPPQLSGALSGWPTLSLAPAQTGEAAVWFAAMLLALLLARRRAGDPEVGAVYRAVWFVLAGALAVEGLVQLVVAPENLAGLRLTSVGRPFGPFVNGTNFAALMELAVPWLIGYAAMRWRRRGRIDPGMAAALATAVLAVAAGLATQSRTGSALLVAGVVLTVAAVARGARQRVRLVAGVLVAFAAGAIAVAFSPLGARFRDAVVTGEFFDPDRIAAWKAIVRMIADFPVAGVGVAAFGHVFRRYVPTGGSEAWWQAHNDWLEWIAVAGVVGGVLLAWFVAGFGREVATGLRRPRRTGDREVLAGLAVGLGCVLVHALVEFNLQIPGVALPVAVAAGCAVAGRGEAS